MRNFRSSVLVVLSLIIVSNVARASAETKIHIVYLGEKQHDDPKLVTESHHQMLSSLLGSKEDAHDSMVYSYRHGFSGFAARLTNYYELATTRTWDYLGLGTANPKNLLNNTNMGDQVIIGVVDTGMSRFHHILDLSLECGLSLNHLMTMELDQYRAIGKEDYYINGFQSEIDGFNFTESPDYSSARDFVGHGTHVASTAGGSYIPDVSYKGLARGTMRGGAPRARIAMYKACWYLEELGGVTCSSSDILKAIDDAIHDGVDVLSLSLGSRIPLNSETDLPDAIAIGSFHAVAKGITVVCAGGNAGPSAQTIANTAPWILTVAATTLDRSFATPIILGNKKVILGQAMYTAPNLGFTSLVYPEDPGNSNETFNGDCESLNFIPIRAMAGKVVLCFTISRRYTTLSGDASFVKRAGGLGLIIARTPGYTVSPCKDDFPCVAVDYELGTDILFYIRSTRSPVVKIQRSRTIVGQPVGIKVATFSSRGPNTISPAILKPDIAAPGVNILAATSPNVTNNAGGFAMYSGTSMAAPVISGVVALLKALHPNWSPAALRSAIVTTGKIGKLGKSQVDSMVGEGPSFSKSAKIPEVDVSTPIGPETISKPAKPTLPEPLEGEGGDGSPISWLNLLAEEVEKGTQSDNVYKDPQENTCRMLTVWSHPESYVLPPEEQGGKASPTNSEDYKTPPEDNPMNESRTPDVGNSKLSRYLTRSLKKAELEGKCIPISSTKKDDIPTKRIPRRSTKIGGVYTPDRRLKKLFQSCRKPKYTPLADLEKAQFQEFQSILRENPAQEFEIVIGIHVSNKFFLSLARPTNWVSTEHIYVLIGMLVRRHGRNYLSGRCRFVDYFSIAGIISKFAEFEKASDQLGFNWGGLGSYNFTRKTPRRNDKKGLLVDVDRVYAPMMWGKYHWVGLVINLTCRQVEILDCNIPHNESDNEVNKHMAYLLRALPHVLAAFSPPSDSSHPEEDQAFSWVRPDNIYFNERSGDCGPCAVKFLEMHAAGYSYEDMGQIDDKTVDIFRQKYAMDTYEEFIGNVKVQNDC
ncbi:unnamed protein product [Brassica napus]|uniref:(rape) hypothetical protein n=1 Tax=Brassica napus TaxID=3708 RepID=A0A816P3W0_BRANA|nr:unnamed protein product [Brassica napus]